MRNWWFIVLTGLICLCKWVLADIENQVSVESLDSEYSSSKHLKSHHLISIQDRCHSMAVYRCGRRLMSVSHFVRDVPSKNTLEARCLLKEAFFECLKRTRENQCQDLNESELHFLNPKFFQEDKFKRKLSDTLWEYRMCTMRINGDH